MIEVPRRDTPPPEPGDYVAVIAGTPLPILARWTGEMWLRGAQKIARMSHYFGPITIERRKHATSGQEGS